MLVIALCPSPIGLDSSSRQRLQPVESRAHLPRAHLGHLDRVQAGLDEGAGHLPGQRLGPLIGPHEVVADGGGHRVLHLGADLGPVLGRIARVDDTLGVLGDGPEPGPQIVVHIGGQVGDAVVEHLLPQRGVLQRVLGLLLAPFQILGEPSGVLGIVDRRQFRAHRQGEMFCGRSDFADNLIAYPVVLAGQHLLGEEPHDRREVRLLVEFLVVAAAPRGCAAATTPESSAATRPARCRCAALASTIWRQCGYRSVLVATTAPTGQISWAWRMNRISGSVNSWLVSRHHQHARRRRAAVRASPTGAAARARRRRGCRRTPGRP